MIEGDYPKILPEFVQRFGRGQVCRDGLAHQNRPHAYHC
jgi:hypothetical protein